MTIRIVLADDHQLVREGLRALLGRDPALEVVGMAEDGAAAIRLVRQLEPDVLVTDVAMPGLNGLEAVRRVHQQQPLVASICLSMHGDQRTVITALNAGASGFVLKDASAEELTHAVRDVAAGRIFLSQGLMGAVVDELRTQHRQSDNVAPVRSTLSLTAREREIVQLFAEDLSTQDIADRLHLSAKTVATHRENITRKLGVRGVAGLTRYAVREGLSTVEPAMPA